MAYCKEFVYPRRTFEAYLLTRSIECLVFAFVLITWKKISMVFIVLMYKFFKSYINNFMVKDSIHFFFRQERRVKIKFSPSQVTFCPTLSGVGSLFQGLQMYACSKFTTQQWSYRCIFDWSLQNKKTGSEFSFKKLDWALRKMLSWFS